MRYFSQNQTLKIGLKIRSRGQNVRNGILEVCDEKYKIDHYLTLQGEV